MSDYKYTPDLEPLIETSPGIFEQPRVRVTSLGPAKPGDTVWISERQDDGTWGPARAVTVVDDTPTIPAGTTDHEQQETT